MTKTIKEILEEDIITSMDDEDLDDAIWLYLCKRINKIEDLQNYRPEVSVYYASHLIEGDVGNGGFAQAAANIPEWFKLAADGYRALGKPESAKIIEEVITVLPSNEEDVRKLKSGEIEWEDYFDENKFSKYDDWVMKSPDWEIPGTRIAYVRAHREAFLFE